VYKIPPKEIYLLLIFAILLAVSTNDLISDFSVNADFNHLAQEVVLIALSLIALIWMLLDIRRQDLEISALREELLTIKSSQPTAEKYVLEAKSKLSAVISQQFQDWKLTDSEKDIGWLLLKGLSLKEIALIRETVEKTVRQQASAIYKKTGLNGRHVFSAWFIEDVL